MECLKKRYVLLLHIIILNLQIQNFSYQLWIVLFNTIAVLSLFVYLTQRQETCKVSYLEAFLQVLRIFCQQGIDGTENLYFLFEFSNQQKHFSVEAKRRESQRILLCTAFLGSILLHTSYSAFIIISLLKSTPLLPFSDLESFALDGSYKMITLPYTPWRVTPVNDTIPLDDTMQSLERLSKNNEVENSTEAYVQVSRNDYKELDSIILFRNVRWTFFPCRCITNNYVMIIRSLKLTIT